MSRLIRFAEAHALLGAILFAVPFAIGQEKPAQSLDDPLPKGAIQRLGSTRLRLGLSFNPYIGFDWNGDIVTAATDGITIWSSRDGSELHRYNLWLRPGWPCAAAQLSADGKRLFACDAFELVGWDFGKFGEQFRVRCSSERDLGGANMVRTADDKVLCLSERDGLTVVDTRKKPPSVQKLALKLKSAVHDFSVTPNGETAAVLDVDKIIFVDVPKLKVAREWKHNEVVVGSVMFLDNRRLAFMVPEWPPSDGKLGVYDLKLEMAVTRNANPNSLQRMTISPDRKLLAYSDASDGIQIVRASDFAPIKSLKTRMMIQSLAFSREGKSIAAADMSRVRVLSIETGKELISAPGHRTAISSIDFSNSGDMAYSGSRGEVICWSVKSGTIKGQIADFAPSQFVTARMIKDRLLTITNDGSMKYWDANNLHPIRVLRDQPAVGTVATISPNGKQFAIAEYPPRLRIADINDPKNAKLINCGSNPIIKLEFSPNGQSAAVQNTKNRISVVDLATGKITKSYAPAQRMPSPRIAFHPDGRLFACIRDDFGPHLYDVSNSQSVENVNLPLRIQIFVFSRDGRLLATGDTEGTVQVWDFKEQKVLATFKGHRGGISCLKFSPDGSILASGGFDTTILLWNVPKVK